MPIVYCKGDLLESDCDIIAHGVNAVGGFGSGVAGQIAKKWPDAKVDYSYHYKYGNVQLGSINYSYIYEGRSEQKRLVKTIAHCCTQYNYLPRGICHADYDAIQTVFKQLKNKILEGYKVGIPRIGAGLAGGDWEIIEAIINKELENEVIYCYTLD